MLSLKYTVEVSSWKRDDGREVITSIRCLNGDWVQLTYDFVIIPIAKKKIFAQYLVIVSFVDKLIMSWSLFLLKHRFCV